MTKKFSLSGESIKSLLGRLANKNLIDYKVGFYTHSVNNYPGKISFATVSGDANISSPEPFLWVSAYKMLFRSSLQKGGLFKPKGYVNQTNHNRYFHQRTDYDCKGFPRFCF